MTSPARFAKKLRTACDTCHASKVKCSGSQPCDTCERLDTVCLYSEANRQGRPKGVRNKNVRAPPRSSKQLQTSRHNSISAMDLGIQTNTFSSSETLEISPAQTSLDEPISSSDCNGSWPGSLDPFDISNLTSGVPIPDFEWTMMLQPTTTESSSHSSTVETIPSGLEEHSHGHNMIASSNIFNGTGSILDWSFQTNSFGKSPTLPRQSLSSSIKICDCAVRYVALMQKMKVQHRESPTQHLDRTLTILRRAHESWLKIDQCNHCRQDLDVDVLLNFVLSIRFVLRSLEETRLEHVCGGGNDGEVLSSDGHSMTDRANTPNLKLGSYEMSGHETCIVRNVLVRRCLSQMKELLGIVRERMITTASRLEMQRGSGSASSWSSSSSRRTPPFDDTSPLSDGGRRKGLPLEMDILEQLLENTSSVVEYFLKSLGTLT